MVFVAVIVVAGASYLSSKRTKAKQQAFLRQQAAQQMAQQQPATAR